MRSTFLQAAFVAALAVLIGFTNVGKFSGAVGDECLHVAATLEMYNSGNWLIPTLDDIPYLNKPPLKMWLSMIPIALLGPNNFAFRFLDALGGVFTALMVWWFGRRVWNSGLAGVVAAIALLGSDNYVFNHGIRNAVQDSWLVMLTTGAVISGGVVLEQLNREKSLLSSRRLLSLSLLCGTLIAAACMTKSVGGLISFPILGLAALLGPIRRNPQKVFTYGLVILSCALLLPALYFVPLYQIYPALFMQTFSREVADRAQSGFHNSSQYWFYLEDLWRRRIVSPELLLLGILVALARVRESFLVRLALLWAIVPVALYSFAATRLPWYIAPAFPGMAILVGGLFSETRTFIRRNPVATGNRWRRPLAIGCLILFSASLLLEVGLVTRRVLRPKSRAMFDLLAEDVRSAKLKNPNEVTILIDKKFRAKFLELPYLNILKPLKTEFSVEQLPQLAHSNPGRTLVFTSKENFAQIKEQIPYTSIIRLPRDHLRNRDMVIFQLGNPPLSDQLKARK